MLSVHKARLVEGVHAQKEANALATKGFFMVQHIFQQTLQQFQELLEHALITDEEYAQQKADALRHLREAFAAKQCSAKEALQTLKESQIAGYFTDDEFDREKKWFLQAMLPSSTPSSVASRSSQSTTPSSQKAQQSPPASSPSHGADVLVTGAASPRQHTPSQHSTKEGEDPLIGRVLMERFRVERFAGAGGMGRVYRCYDQHKEGYYALKLLPSFFAEDASFRQRMLQEIRINERLSHTGIVRTYDVFHLSGVGTFFTMEWLEGRTLEHIINDARQREQKPAIPLSRLATLLQSIGDALVHAHQHGVVHRDLKPANLMILSEHQTKVMDFGIAKIVDAHTTRHTGMTGTLFYMAPEQMRGTGHVTPAADVYSLAAVLYETLTLELPVGRIIPPSRLCKELPSEVDEIILKALESRPKDRYTNVSDFLQAILPWLNETHMLSGLYLEAINHTANFLEQKRELKDSFVFLQAMAVEDARAMALLGDCYKHGWGVDEDEDEAFACYQKAASQGDPHAQHNIAEMHAVGSVVEENENEAFAWNTKAAKQGHPNAQATLGDAYRYGWGIEKDYEQSVFWYKKAGENGHMGAQHALGNAYSYGWGVEEDDNEAVIWYRRSAEQGNPDAQAALGDAYKHGWGVEQNDAKAATWYRKAAEQGHLNAQATLGDAYRHGWGVIENDQESIEWYRKAAEQGHDGAQAALGDAYKYGWGVEQNDASATLWYKRAAKHGNAHAEFNLGLIFQEGDGVVQNTNRALHWFRKAAKQGHSEAQTNFGVMLRDGLGIKQNYTEALIWLRKAAEQDQADAQTNLGWMYEQGLGVEQDKNEAIMWYARGAEQGNEYAQEALERINGPKKQPRKSKK